MAAYLSKLINAFRLSCTILFGLFICEQACGDGLHDVQIIPPGNYPVQANSLPANYPLGIVATGGLLNQGPQTVPLASQSRHGNLCLSPSLTARLRLPGEQTVYPLANLSGTSLSPENCPTHVHNFYHSGRASFQCPIIQGGRTRVVTVHPATGEPIEFFVMLAPGAPRVEYHRTHFAYVYPDGHSTVVKFPTFNPLKPRVVVAQQPASPIKQHTQSLIEHWQEHREKVRNSNTVQALNQAHADLKRSGEGMTVLADRGFGGVIETSQAITDLLPGKAYLQSLGEQRVLDERDNQIRRVQLESENERRFIRWPD